MQKPLVSAIIAAYNMGKYLPETLDSILKQTYDNVEIILVDDGSTDDTADIVALYKTVIYFYQANGGVSKARNTAIKASKGQYLAFIDADDIWMPEKLEKQTALMCENPELGYSYTGHRCFLDSSMDAPPLWVRKEHFTDVTPGYIPSSLMISRDALDIVGLFDETYRIAEDVDWLLRAKECAIPTADLSECLLLKRVHSTNLTGLDIAQQALFCALSSSIKRKKGKGGALGD